MDVTALLYRNRPTRDEDYNRKCIALRNAFTIVQSIEPNKKTKDFLERSCDILGHVYGGEAQDSYLTTVMSVALNFSEEIDVYLASVLNSIVLQMNFQTRTFIDGRQSVVFDGAGEYFPLAMLHGNETQGLFVTDTSQATDMPVWVNASPSLEVRMGQLFNVTLDEIPNYQSSNGGNKTSALLIVNPNTDYSDFSIAERYGCLNSSVGENTIYCISGSAEMVFATARDLQHKYPGVRINLKGYCARGGREYRAILHFSGLNCLPDVIVRPGISRECIFGIDPAAMINELASISYGDGVIVGRPTSEGVGHANGIWELANPRSPFLLSSSAPLPLEAMERISDPMEVLHTTLRVKHGILIPSQDASHSTFLVATEDGRVVEGLGAESTQNQIFKNAVSDENGIHRGKARLNKLSRVKGAAMPLMFTPMLHKWHSHFMIQCLPRVRIARDLDEDMTILVPHDLRKKQLEMLELLGFGNDRLLKIEHDEIVMADRLYYPWPWRLAFTQYTAAVYDEIAKKIDLSGIMTPKRILISRESRKSWRNLLNYESVRQMLVEDFGFQVVAPEKMTLAEEVATYANAEIVVGAEGAGMYGAAFSPPATKYLTMCDEDYVMPILATLASVRGFDIGYVFGESSRSDADVARRLPNGHADFVIDVDRLSRAVRDALDE